MKPTVTNYYHQTLKGTWYILKAVSKAMFFFSLGLLVGFLLFFFDKIKEIRLNRKISDAVTFTSQRLFQRLGKSW